MTAACWSQNITPIVVGVRLSVMRSASRCASGRGSGSPSTGPCSTASCAPCCRSSRGTGCACCWSSCSMRQKMMVLSLSFSSLVHYGGICITYRRRRDQVTYPAVGLGSPVARRPRHHATVRARPSLKSVCGRQLVACIRRVASAHKARTSDSGGRNRAGSSRTGLLVPAACRISSTRSPMETDFPVPAL